MPSKIRPSDPQPDNHADNTCGRPPGVASWGFKSLARKTGPVSGRDCGRELSAASGRRLPCFGICSKRSSAGQQASRRCKIDRNIEFLTCGNSRLDPLASPAKCISRTVLPLASSHRHAAARLARPDPRRYCSSSPSVCAGHVVRAAGLPGTAASPGPRNARAAAPVVLAWSGDRSPIRGCTTSVGVQVSDTSNPHERPFTGMLDRHPRSACGRGGCSVSASA